MRRRWIGYVFVIAYLLVSWENGARAQTGSIWISAAELAQLPASGPAWNNLKAEADKPTGAPNISNQNDPTNVRVLAKALVYARTGIQSYRTEVINACMAAIGTEEGGRTLALGRELIAYVIAADLVGLPASQNAIFRAWLQEVRTKTLGGRTLVSTHEDRPNNWGTHCGASRAAVAVYLNDIQEMNRCAQVFKGYLGDRASYAGFSYGDLDWQVNPNLPVGINPQGSVKQGHSIDGVLPDDQRRAGGFHWPPPKENYVYEALQGALAQAVILYRAGYTGVRNWEDQALLRAFQWLHEQANFPATGDDTWQPHLINFYYGASFPAPIPSTPGKNVGWTDWTHGGQNTGAVYNLNVTIAGSGDVVLNPPGGVYLPATVVTLSAVPAAGYVFSGWSGDLGGTANPATITMDEHKSVTATFTSSGGQQYTLTVYVAGSGSVELSPPGGTYPAGTVVTLTANPAAGYAFGNWSGNLNGNSNPATLTMNSDKTVTATFLPGGGAGPIVFKEIKTGGSTGSSLIAASAPLGGTGGDLYLAAISAKPNTPANSVSGLGLSWSLVGRQCSGRNQTGVEVWMARGTPSGNGIVAAQLSSTPESAVIAVARYSGVDSAQPLGAVISGNTTGLSGSCSGGSDGDSYIFDLEAVSDSAVVFCAAALRNKEHSPGSGFTERVEVHAGSGGGGAGIAVQERALASAGMVPVNGAFNEEVDWAIFGLELRPAGSVPLSRYNLTVNIAGSGSVQLDPPGGVYDEGTIVALTAVPAAGYIFNGWSGDLNGNANPATLVMNADKEVTASFADTVGGGPGAIMHRETRTGGSGNSEVVSTAASLAGVEGDLYLAAISTKRNTPVQSVSGLGLVWTPLGGQCSGRDQTGIEVWMAQGTPSGSGVVTAVLAGVPKNAAIAVSRYSGVDTANPLGMYVSGNTRGINGSCSGGNDSDHYLFNITANAAGSLIYCAVAIRNRNHTEGNNFFERAEFTAGSGGDMAGIAIADREIAAPAAVPVDGAFNSSVDWAAAAVEIRPAGTGSFSEGNPVVFKPDKIVALGANYPNPFNPKTQIRFAVRNDNRQLSSVRLIIYNMLGMRVRQLISAYMAPGEYLRAWDGRDDAGREVAAGVYIYQVIAHSRDRSLSSMEARRMILVR